MALGVDMSIFPYSGFLFGIFLVWVLIWKGLGLWHSARNKQKIWFIAMLVLNTVGILPIIYLLFFRRRGLREIKKELIKPAKRKKRKRK